MSFATDRQHDLKLIFRNFGVGTKVENVGDRCRDERVCRMCFYQLEMLSKKQYRVRNEWSPLRVFGGRQLAHVAYETASRLIVGNRSVDAFEEIPFFEASQNRFCHE